MNKNIANLLIGLLLTFFFISCNSDDEKVIPSNISNVSYEAYKGALKLKWDVPADSGYYYVEVKYYDSWKEKDVIKLASVYSDTMRIEGLLKKFGEYEFTLQTISVTGDRGEEQKIKGSCLPREAEYAIRDAKPLKLMADMLSTNAQEPSEGPISNILDGDAGTFFHSKWSGDGADLWPHYIQVNLPEKVEAFRLSYANRKNSNGKPKVLDVLVSEDGTNFESHIVLSTGLPKESGSTYNSSFFMIQKEISAIKLLVTECHAAGDKFFSLAELGIDKGTIEVYDPENE